ncbi:MAG: thiol peroxidase [Fusobacteriaceae bacterium]
MERKDVIKFQGSPLTLVGEEIKVGATAPNFTAVKNDLSPCSLSDLKGKVVIVSAMPSVDTGVCELQTLRFNEEAKKHPEIQIVTISLDLPFALGRFCGAKGVENAVTLSDYQNRDFAHKYGFFIKELALITRGIIVIGKDGIVKHVQYVPEVTDEPDYEKALQAAVAAL